MGRKSRALNFCTYDRNQRILLAYYLNQTRMDSSSIAEYS